MGSRQSGVSSPDGTPVVLDDAGFVGTLVSDVEYSIAIVVGIGTTVVVIEMVVVLGSVDTPVDRIWYAVEISVRFARSC